MPANSIRKNNVTIVNKGNFKKTIVFAHGFGTDHTAWKDVIVPFVEDYRIVLYDNVGAGNSDPAAFSPNKYDTLNSYANDLKDICNDLEIEDAILIAHSVSGMIGILASRKDPKMFSKLILVGASPRYQNDTDYVGGFELTDLEQLFSAMENNYFAWVSGFAAYAMANQDKPQLAESFAATLGSIRPDIALSVARVIFLSDYRSQLPALNKPTLLLQTKHDIAVPMDVAEYLHKNIADSKLVVIDAEGHFPHISAPQEVINAIQQFI